MENSKEVLTYIITRINAENEMRSDNFDFVDDNDTISGDRTNECLLSIFRDAENEFDIDANIEDDEGFLTEMFGVNGYELIRNAEKGIESDVAENES